MTLKTRLSGLIGITESKPRHAEQDNQDPQPDPAVRARLLELVRAGHSVDYLIYAAHQMRTGRAVGTSR